MSCPRGAQLVSRERSLALILWFELFHYSVQSTNQALVIDLLNLLSTYYVPLPILVGSKDPFFYGASILVAGGAEEGGRQEINTINK